MCGVTTLRIMFIVCIPGLHVVNFGHLMRRVDSLEKTLMLGGIGGKGGEGEDRG